MDLVKEVVDVQLSEEETKVLLRAQVICRELAVKLHGIAVKKQPDALENAKKACKAIAEVKCWCGKYIDEDEDDEYAELEKKDDELYAQGEFEHMNWKVEE